MIEIPKQLQNKKIRFIKIASGTKKPIEEDWTEGGNYRYTESEFKQYLKTAKSYGIACGFGDLVIVDIENIEDKSVFNLVIKQKFPETFITQTGGGGWHLYYFVSGINKQIKLNKEGKHYGEIQVKGNQCIGPGSIHSEGTKYIIFNPAEIKTIDKDSLLTILKDFIEEEKEFTLINTGRGLNWNISKLVDVCRKRHWLKTSDDVIYRGPHPAHPSTSGTNFEIDVKKNVWHCWRCGKGGDAVTLIAMLEKLVKFDDFCPTKEQIRKEFKTIKKVGIEKYGYPDNDYKSILKSTLDSKELKLFIYQGNKKKLNTKGIVDYFKEQYPTIVMESITGKGSHIYVYQDGYYKLNGQNILQTFIKTLFNEYNELWTSYYENEIIKYVKTFKAMSRNDFQIKDHLINFNNGIYNLKTKKLKNHTFKEYFLYKIPWNYKPEMPLSPSISKYFKSTFNNRQKHIDFVQELFGYCLYSKYNYHGLFYLYGTGGNGKTVFLSLLENLLGQDNVTNKSINSLVTKRFTSAHLYGKLLNSCGELSGYILNNTDMLKRLTAGDRIEAEFKGLDGFDFSNIAKIITACNSIPQSLDDSDGWYDRQFIIPFLQKFRYSKEEDNELAEKLVTKKNMESLLYWSLQGLHRLLKNKGFTYPKNKKDIYLMYQGNTKYFINKFYKRSENLNDFIRVDDIRIAYKKWCEKNDVPLDSNEALARAFRYFKLPKAELISENNKKIHVRYGMKKC